MVEQELKPHIIGLTGSFGSGCSYIADNILVKHGYKKVSLTAILKILYEKDGNKLDGASRRALQDFGDELRNKKGNDFLAKKAFAQISTELKENQTAKWVVDSIRNPAEVSFLRSISKFFLFGIYAEKDTRWHRVKKKYQSNRGDFDDDDKNDTGNESDKHGQRVGDCFSEADIVLSNSKKIDVEGNVDFQKLEGLVTSYSGLTEKPLEKKQPLRKEEALMAMAYAASQQSSCLKRKVGAIIVDEFGNVISSGFNEVPRDEQPCKDKYTMCYRDKLSNEFPVTLRENFDLAGQEYEIMKLFRQNFKMLDYCRALHAEENAIINLVRNGSSASLKDCVLYTTTYPCRLCANKIVNSGIKNIVYLEPYPDDEAKAILKSGGITDCFFQGVTFKAYFRIYGDEKL